MKNAEKIVASALCAAGQPKHAGAVSLPTIAGVKLALFNGLGAAGALGGALSAPEDHVLEGGLGGYMAGAGAGLGGEAGASIGELLGPALAKALKMNVPAPAMIGRGAGAALGLYGGAQAGNAAFGATNAGERLNEAKAEEKTAALPAALMHALGGAGIGGLAGGAMGGMAAHARGGDVGSGAAMGALGGAGLGAGIGGLGSGMNSTMAGALKDKMMAGGAMGLMSGAGGLFGGALMRSVSGDSDANVSKSKEVGKMLAQQEMKQKSQMELAPLQQQAFQAAMRDPMISRADPELLQSSFETMKRFAPNLAADPNAVKSFLKEVTTWDTGPSYATLKNLADAERAVASAGGMI